MKSFFLLMLFYGFMCNGQDSKKINRYFLEGEIINKIELPPDCGIFAFATVIEFKIIKFSDTSYTKKNIPIIFACPEFYGKSFFKVGAIYNIDIEDKNQETIFSIINRQLLNKYHYKKELWATNANKYVTLTGD